MKTIATFVGSLRAQSLNRRLAGALEGLADGTLRFVYPDLGALPHYNDDLWHEGLPQAVHDFKAVADGADAVLFVMPEYNRFPPPILVNATAWGSRPYGQSSFTGKPAAIIGTSPGAIGTAGGQALMRSHVVSLGAILMPRPEVYLQAKSDLFGDDGKVTDAATETFLRGFVEAFGAFIDRLGTADAGKVSKAA